MGKHCKSPPGCCASMLIKVVSVGLAWIFAYLLLQGSPQEEWIFPGGRMWAMGVLLIGALVGGSLAARIKMPPLLGMLIVGFMLRNIADGAAIEGLPEIWGSTLRSLALTVILLRAGLGLDLDALKRLGLPVVALTFLPGVTEASTVAAMGCLLFDLPVLWGFLMGFVLAAVSPAVVVPGLLNLQLGGYGTVKGIPTMVLAAASFDDVVAITAFGVLLGLAFAGVTSETQSVTSSLLHALLEVGAGLIGGILLGCFCVWVVSLGTRVSQSHNSSAAPALEVPENIEELAEAEEEVELVVHVRPEADKSISRDVQVQNENIRPTGSANGSMVFLLTGVTGSVAMLGARSLGYTGSGALACITMGATIAKLGGKQVVKAAENGLKLTWTSFAQPLLFSLIGSAVKTEFLQPDLVGNACAVLGAGLAVRAGATWLCGCLPQANLVCKERLFLVFAWLPKATVQAAIGATALDIAREHQARDEEEWGRIILTVAALSIVITAPVGAVLIALTGPKLLDKSN